MTATTVPVVGAIDWRKSSTPAQVTGVDLRIDYYLYSFLHRYCVIGIIYIISTVLHSCSSPL